MLSMSADLVVVIPTLGRAHVLAALVANIEATAPGCPVLFVVEDTDTPTRDVAAVLPVRVEVIRDGGYPKASNAGFKATWRPFVLIAGDDVVFHPEWREAALAAFEDPVVGVVGPADLTLATEGGGHATMPVVRRSYIEDPGGAFGEPGNVFHEGYHHNFSETELCAVAQVRGVWAHAPECVIEHLHPSWGTAPMDATYEKGGLGPHWDRDSQLFEDRQAMWSR